MFFSRFMGRREGEKAKSLFSSIVKESLGEIYRFYPVLATERGIHLYDYRLASFKESKVKRYIQNLSSLCG